MVTVDQMKIKDIPSSAVPYELPVCKIHGKLTYVKNVARDEDEANRTLIVTRYCRCDECYNLKKNDISVVNSRKF